MQERRNSIANTLELRLSCTNPSIYSIDHIHIKVWDVIVHACPTFNFNLHEAKPLMQYNTAQTYVTMIVYTFLLSHIHMSTNGCPKLWYIIQLDSFKDITL